jgi:hypothetical protein
MIQDYELLRETDQPRFNNVALLFGYLPIPKLSQHVQLLHDLARLRLSLCNSHIGWVEDALVNMLMMLPLRWKRPPK